MKKDHLKGKHKVLKNLNREIRKIRGRTEKGLYRAAIPIRADAQRLCPVVTGNLKASAYIIITGGTVRAGADPSFRGENARKMKSQHETRLSERSGVLQNTHKPLVEIGFTALYAPIVHENPNAGRTGEEGASTVGQWKFLETSLKNNQRKAIETIAREARRG